MSYLVGVSVLLALAALATGQARGDEYWRTIPYDKLHDAFQSVKPLDGAKYIRLDRSISTSAPGMTLDDVRMVIETGSGTLEVGIGDDGSLDFPMDEALLAANPPVRVNVPEGQLAINVEIEWEIPVTQTFGYALVTDVEDEYRRFVKAQGMLARMMAPDLAGLAVRFPDGERATATVSAPAGVVIEAGEDGRIVIPSGKSWDDAEVLLSRMPAGLEPVFEN